MPVRLKDIAKDLGVSIITVSKVLRNHSDISEKTRQRVLQRMKELDYQPNMTARALVTGHSYAVGFLAPELTAPFFALISRGMHVALKKKGYSLIISSSFDNQDLERREIDMLLARRVDALVIATTQQTTESFRHIQDKQIPFVLVDRNIQGMEANFVGVDDRVIGHMATQHLLEMGCRRIAHIRGPAGSTAMGRLEGYRQALFEKGIPFKEEMVKAIQYCDKECINNSYTAVKELLACKPRPDGIFCFNDPCALGATKAILENKLRVPQDIALIGSGNFLFTDFLRVPLSTVDQNAEAIGDRAAKLAMHLVESKTPVKPKSILLEPNLIVRESTARK